jgi:hypothetical protein
VHLILFILHQKGTLVLVIKGGSMGLKRKPPEGNERRVRYTSKNSYGICINQVGEIVQYESDKEKQLLLTLLQKRRIKKVTSQPIVIPYQDLEQKNHSYIPDFEADDINGNIEIYEFSLEERRGHDNIKSRERGAQKFLEQKGWSYIVQTEHDLPKPTRMSNIRALRKYCPKVYFNQQLFVLIMEKLASTQAVKLFELEDYILNIVSIDRQTFISSLFHLMWHQYINFEETKLLFDDGIPDPYIKIWIEKE